MHNLCRLERRRSAVPLVVALLVAACTSATSTPVDLIVFAPRMLDVRSGTIVADRAVIIRDGRITSIVESSYAHRLASTQRIVLPPSATLLPGFIDTHVHLAWKGGQNELAARATLMAGFTTVRNPGASGNADVELRNAIEEGRVPGPRMLIAHTGIGSKGGICEATFGEPGVDTPSEGTARVRKLIGEGADFIKICAGGPVIGRAADANTTELSPDVLAAIVAEAHRQGKRVAAHAQGPAAIRAAATAGVDSIEHGGLIDDDTARLLAQKKIALVPTLARLTAPQVREETTARIRRAHELGVPIVFGTDGGVLPHGENAREFESLLAAGLTPLETIRAATIDAARLLGWEHRIGVIAEGLDADLIAVTNDVLQPTPMRVRLVISRGRVVRDDLE